MYFRFGGSFLLIVAIALAGTHLEQQNLSLRRKLSRQHYQRQVLHEFRAEAVLAAHAAGAPQRLLERLPDAEQTARRNVPAARPAPATSNPLLSIQSIERDRSTRNAR